MKEIYAWEKLVQPFVSTISSYNIKQIFNIMTPLAIVNLDVYSNKM